MKKLFVVKKLLLLLILFLHILDFSAANTPINALIVDLNEMDSVQTPKEWVLQCIDIGDEYRKIPEYSIAIDYYKRAKRLADEQQFNNELNDINIKIAESLHGFGQYKSSLKYAHQVLKKLPKDSLQARGLAYRIAGINQVMLGEYSEAYASQMQARSIYSELGDSSLVARVEFGLGNNFFYQEQYELSLKHFQNALSICEKIDLEKGIYKAYNAIGSVFEAQGNLQEALNYCNAAIELATSLEDKRGAAWALMNIGSILCKIDRCDEGLLKLQESRQLAIDMDDRPLESYTLETLALNYSGKKNYDLALQYLLESEKLVLETDDRSNIISIYQNFADIYYQKGDFKNYKVYTDKFLALKDSLHNEKLIDRLSSLQSDFSLQEMERENEIVLIKKENEISRLQSVTGFAVGSGILATTCFLLFLLYTRNRATREKNELLNQKNQEILQQIELLKSSNQDLEKYAYIISHDLKEPLRNVSGFATLLKRRLKGEGNEQTQEYLQFIIKGAQQMHFLLHDLLQYSKIGVQEATAGERIATQQLVTDVLKDMTHQLENVHAKVEVHDLPNVTYHRTFLYQIFLNLIGNSIKFRSEESLTIDISCQVESNHYVFALRDNGIGIASEYHQKIFEVFQRLHNREEYQGSGIGLATCRKIIKKNGGDIWVESAEGEGATFRFSIPIEEEYLQNGIVETKAIKMTANPVFAVSN